LLSDAGIQHSTINPEEVTPSNLDDIPTNHATNEPLRINEKSKVIIKDESDLLESKLAGDEENNHKIDRQETGITDSEELPNGKKIVNSNNNNAQNTSTKRRLTIPILIASIFVIATIGVIAIINNDNDQASSDYKSTEPPVTSKTENEIPSNKPIESSPEKNDNYKTWDETKAKEIVLNELQSYKRWSGLSENPQIQEIIKFEKVGFLQDNYMVTLAYTNDEYNDTGLSYASLSFFEFKYDDAWVLSRKSIDFASIKASSSSPDYKFVPIASNKYGLTIEESDSHQGYDHGWIKLYTHIGDSLKCVLSVINYTSNTGAGGKEEYTSNLSISNSGSGYYPIELIEKGKREDGSVIDNKIEFQFNGEKYANTSGIKPYGHGY